LSRRNSARSSRFPKSAACIIATSVERPEPAPPVRRGRDPLLSLRRLPSHSPRSPLFLCGPDRPQIPAALVPVPILSPWLSREPRPSTIEADGVLAKDR
jgi:hypothetical protein